MSKRKNRSTSTDDRKLTCRRMLVLITMVLGISGEVISMSHDPITSSSASLQQPFLPSTTLMDAIDIVQQHIRRHGIPTQDSIRQSLFNLSASIQEEGQLYIRPQQPHHQKEEKETLSNLSASFQEEGQTLAPQQQQQQQYQKEEENDFWKFVHNYQVGPGLSKWTGYLNKYHHHFNRFRQQDKVILVEIGVQSGGSVDFFKDYFGEGTLHYIGIDIDPRTKVFERPGVEIVIGDQSNRTFLREFKATQPLCDILIDDGGHTMFQQKVSLLELFWHVRDGGVYLIEDLHTSYWPAFDGGYKREGTMIEEAKDLFDVLNARWSVEEGLQENEWTWHIGGFHAYDGMLFIDKERTELMQTISVGDQWITGAF